MAYVSLGSDSQVMYENVRRALASVRARKLQRMKKAWLKRQENKVLKARQVWGKQAKQKL